VSKVAGILVVDDEKAIRNTLKEILEYEGYQVETAHSGEEALSKLPDLKADLVLLDIKMPGMDGMECFEAIQEAGFDIPVIMISGHGTIELAVEATKRGAFDFIQKPPDLNRLLLSVRNALSQSVLKTENKRIRARLPETPPIIGESEAIRKVKEVIDKVARTSSRVLITGPNGSGKELVARWIHEKSDRSGTFVAVNCAAIPAELIESELFGYRKGAFTGATEDRKGKFEAADGGTLFLDEIGDMPLSAQAKVLRALQESQIQPLGSSEKIKLDIRVITATNKNLSEEVQEKNFREDLYHRISVIPIEIPPLLERPDDIPLLAKHFIDELRNKEISLSNLQIEEDALTALQKRNWPGNVRELQNVIERLAVLSADQLIREEEVKALEHNTLESADFREQLGSYDSFQDFKAASERVFLIHQLNKHHWNISKTAEAIGLQRSHIYNKIKSLGIER
jgi:DNA-binding NtrC family response regulator